MPIVESPARLPGWTLIRGAQKGNRYRSPDGHEVGQWAYATALKHYQKTGIVPQTPLGEAWKKYQKGASSSARHTPVYEDLSIEVPAGAEDESILVQLPEVTAKSSGRTKAGFFNAREMSQGLATLLVIMTSIAAVALRLPEAQMTEQEVRAISIPLANIIERSKYNKAVGGFIVDKSDYMTLGYALYVYVDRVAAAARSRHESANQGPVRNSGQAPGAEPGAGVNGRGAPLPPTPAGLRGFTPGV